VAATSGDGDIELAPRAHLFNAVELPIGRLAVDRSPSPPARASTGLVIASRVTAFGERGRRPR